MQKVVPAILTTEPSKLSYQLSLLREQVKWVHIDIMDGKFVPNNSISISELGEVGQFFNLELHLMVQDPEKYFEDCKEVGAKRVYFHLEATRNPAKTLSFMEQYSFQRGVVLNPETLVSALVSVVEKVEDVLLMSVVPGSQGHEFIPHVADKIRDIRGLHEKLLIGMDGGVVQNNILSVFEKGVDYIVVGSGIWQTKDPIAALRKLQEMVS